MCISVSFLNSDSFPVEAHRLQCVISADVQSRISSICCVSLVPKIYTDININIAQIAAYTDDCLCGFEPDSLVIKKK